MVLGGGCQPALLIRQSIRPYFSAVFSISPDISSGFETSHFTNQASPRSELLSSEESSSPSWEFRAQNTTREPASTKARTHPLPIPFVPPVTITTLSR